MADEIINRVANSNLMTIDLENFYPQGTRSIIDIKNWLFQEVVLKETEFREYIKNHDWSAYQDHYVALTCSSDAVIPSWAFMLVAANVAPFTKKLVVGDLKDLETLIFHEIIAQFNVAPYKDKPVIIKGCAHKPIPENAYTELVAKLHPVVKSIMFGEACSTVPLFKKNKNI